MSTFLNKVYVLGLVFPSFSRNRPKRPLANWGFVAAQFRQSAKSRKTFPKTYTYIFQHPDWSPLGPVSPLG